MRFPQVLVYENDGRIAGLLKVTVQDHEWSLRELRQPEACLSLLRRGGLGVVVLKVGHAIEREIAVLEQLSFLFPEARTVVVGDEANPPLAGLAWEFGATYVLFPPQSRDLLPGLVAELMAAALRYTPRGLI